MKTGKNPFQEDEPDAPDNTVSLKIVFSIFVAPRIHEDTIYMSGYSKHQYDVDIIPLDVSSFITKISENNRIVDVLKN